MNWVVIGLLSMALPQLQSTDDFLARWKVLEDPHENVRVSAKEALAMMAGK